MVGNYNCFSWYEFFYNNVNLKNYLLEKIFLCNFFIGWTKEYVVDKVKSLKDTFVRRSLSNSESNSHSRKCWKFEKYFSFLNNMLAPPL